MPPPSLCDTSPASGGGRALALCLALLAGPAGAAELTVFSGGSMAAPLRAAGADFTRATGVQVHFVTGPTGFIAGKVNAGEPSDVLVVSREGLAALRAAGKTAAGAPVPVGRAVIGVAVKAGAARPDISTPEAFRAAILAARSIADPDPKLGAASTLYLQTVFARLGIAEAAQAKTQVYADGAHVAEAVGTGQAELGLTFLSELSPDTRVAVVGPLPAALQQAMPYEAQVSANSREPELAARFIAFVTSAAETARFTEGGVER